MKKIRNSKRVKVRRKRNDNKRQHGNLFIVFGSILFIMLGFFAYQGFIFYQCKLENDRLFSLKSEYKSLSEEIASYEELKSQYEVILSEETDLGNNKEMLEKKIDTLSSDIKNIETKIVDINKKIKALS